MYGVMCYVMCLLSISCRVVYQDGLYGAEVYVRYQSTFTFVPEFTVTWCSQIKP